MDKMNMNIENENGKEIKENLDKVQRNIAAACKRANRDISEVTLVAVSKTKPVSAIKKAYDAGCRDFGENKVQELRDKFEQVPSDVRWHLIGHLQTNKIKYIIDKVYMIHSVDSFKLAQAISKEAVKRDITVRILIEVNVAEEESKFGNGIDASREMISQIYGLPNLIICGLMTVAPYTVEPETNRQYFVALRRLYVDVNAENKDNSCMTELSMGMTGDYEVAIEEGATMIRVGTGIFGERDYSI